MTAKRAFSTILVASIAWLMPLAGGAAAQGRFFLRAGAGVGIPMLENLDNELSVQGNEKVRPGYTLGVSLGRSFAANQWSLELAFATAFFPDFTYENEHEGFTGKLRHYDYMGILRRHWRTEENWWRFSVGLGAGYGQTNLVSGGGKLGAFQGLGTLRVESKIAENICLALEGTYNFGLQTKAFAGPFLENFASDAVLTSAGVPLEDKYDSFDIRLGATVWLRQMLQE